MSEANTVFTDIYSWLQRLSCKIGQHDFDEQRHSIASSNVGEVTKTCQRCGKTVHEYVPR